MSAALAVKKALRQRFVGLPALVALVPADNILDRNARPAPEPSIILGEDQQRPEGDVARRNSKIFSTLHVWKKEDGLSGVAEIVGAMSVAIRQGRLALGPGLHCGDCYVSDVRFLRDPDGETAHAVVTVETMVQEMTA